MSVSNANAGLAAIEDPTTNQEGLVRALSIRTRDFDELAGCLPAWDLRLMQFSHGLFQGSGLIARVRGFQIYEFEGNRTVLVRGTRPPDSYEFTVIHDENAGALWRGGQLRPGLIKVTPGSDTIDHRTSQEYRGTTLLVEGQTARRLAQQQHGVDLNVIPSGGVIEVGRRRAGSLDAQLRSILRQLASESGPGHPAAVVETALTAWLSEVIGLVIPERLRVPARTSPASRARVARMAEEHMVRHLGEQTSLTDLCAMLDVSERTLMYAFQEAVGLSPKRFFKTVKLNRLRQELRAANPQSAKVHVIAARLGLKHAGLLAADYRRLFGELPGETLARASARSVSGTAQTCSTCPGLIDPDESVD